MIPITVQFLSNNNRARPLREMKVGLALLNNFRENKNVKEREIDSFQKKTFRTCNGNNHIQTNKI